MPFPGPLPTEQARSLFNEFRAFAFKGNVIDLAIGVVIGTGFSSLTKSMVDNLLMPTIGLILPGDEGYAGWKLTVQGQTIPYGKFLGDVVNFLILAAVLFVIVVKLVGWLRSFHEDKTVEAPALTKDQELLTEIRDLLRRSDAGAGPGTTP